IVSGNDEIKKVVEEMKDLISKAANVKDVAFSARKEQYAVKMNYAIAGKKFGKDIKRIADALSKEDAGKLKEKIDKGVKVNGFTLTKDDLIFTTEKGEGKEFEGGRIVLDTNVTESMKREWLVRELMRAVQDTRKHLGLKVGDKIKLYLPKEFKDSEKIIKETTGSIISFGALKGKKQTFEFEEEKYEFGVEK
ncbi:MAG: DUF5915 domain-containing protein, partial [Candidatus Aenigmarchaeota archaeon]|nr:DUF5915 domain-containing protein [Candidatus Aenigmarchaeota archaeon]